MKPDPCYNPYCHLVLVSSRLPWGPVRLPPFVLSHLRPNFLPLTLGSISLPFTLPLQQIQGCLWGSHLSFSLNPSGAAIFILVFEVSRLFKMRPVLWAQLSSTGWRLLSHAATLQCLRGHPGDSFSIPPPLHSTQLECRHILPFICQAVKRGKCWFANFQSHLLFLPGRNDVGRA